MASASAPEPGTVIGEKYRVERVLGQGGMGVVLEATHLALDKRVALKVLRIEAADEQARQRFAREARIAAQLSGEHVAEVRDFGQTPAGEPYLVMELLVGNDLERELATRGPLPVAEAVDLVLQAGEGVAEAHAAGLVHRDLKPANLFLVRRRDGTPLVKVLDFGLSKLMSDRHANLTSTETTFGTPQYMSPEQIRSAKYVDARTDQHALAMILYELVTGKPAYVAESVTGLYVVISTAAPAPMSAHRPDVPSGLEAAILRALAKSPGDRFADVAALGEALAPFGGPGAIASATRMAAALGREAPRLSAPVAVEPVSVAPIAAPVATQPVSVAPIAAPVAVQTLFMPVAVQPVVVPPLVAPTVAPVAVPPARRTGAALAVGAGVVALVGMVLVVRWLGQEPAPAVVAMAPVSSATATPATLPSTPSSSSPPVIAADTPTTTPAPEPPASASGSESGSTVAKPLRPGGAKPDKKAVDRASDIFGQRRK